MPDWMWHIFDVFRNTYTYRVAVAFAELFWLVLPYFVAGILLIALLTRYFPKVEKLPFFRRDDLFAIFIAAALGVISPLATYLAVPFGAMLINMEFATAPIIAFVVASPLMNPNLFVLTAGVLGLKLAIARTMSAWLLGIGAGVLYRVFARRNVQLLAINAKSSVRLTSKRSYWQEVWAHSKFVSKYFLISLLISAIVRELVPAELIAKALGAHASLSILIAVALGVPLYSCGGAAIPIMRVLMDMGMTPGAVLAFFISGPATKLSTVYVYKSAMGWKMLVFYLGLTLVGALVFGYLYGML